MQGVHFGGSIFYTEAICCMMELDEKYASVILRRYVGDTGNAEGVFVTRGGKQIPYAELVKEVETKGGGTDDET